MKKILKILLGIVVVIALAMAAVFYFTADMVTAADEFFLAVKNKDMETAYSYLSDDFKAGTSQSELQAFLDKNNISRFKQANWKNRSVSGGRGDLVGSITTESGGVVPLKLDFVKGDSGWKIYSIQKPPSGIQQESSSIQIPSEQGQVRLVAESMRVFADSVNAKSMVQFHSHVSNLWQQQYTPGKFDETFAAFYDFKGDLTVLEKYTPQFSSKPSVNDDGVLTISGHYPTEPSKVQFEQDYIYEGLSWKLMGFSINVL